MLFINNEWGEREMNKCKSFLVELKWNKNTPFFYNPCSCLCLRILS